MTASAAVLGTAELLELIFSNLGMRDILASERVSYLWRSVVFSSCAVRRRKYILPDPSPAPGLEANPVFLQHFIQQAALYAVRRVNPSATFLGTASFVRNRIKAFADGIASWRDMLLFQPPCTAAYMRPLSARFEDDSYLIKNHEGLMMKDVVKFFEESINLRGPVAVHLLTATVTTKVMWVLTPDAATVLPGLIPYM